MERSQHGRNLHASPHSHGNHYASPKPHTLDGYRRQKKKKSVLGSICPCSSNLILVDTLRRGKGKTQPRPTLSLPPHPPHLGLPLHSSQRDGQQHGHSDHADDANVIGGVYNRCAILLGRADQLCVLSSPLHPIPTSFRPYSDALPPPTPKELLYGA